MKKIYIRGVIVFILFVAGASIAKGAYGYGGGGGGGGGSSSLERDYCPDGDNTLSFYDGLCGTQSIMTAYPSVINAVVPTLTVVGSGVTVTASNPTVEEVSRILEMKETLEASPADRSFVLPAYLPMTGAQA